MTGYRSSPMAATRRRSRSDMAELRRIMLDVIEADRPMTVRQVFYRLVSMGAIRKAEGEYNHTVTRLLTEMRLAGELPYDWIADNTRWMRKPRTFSSLTSALQRTAEAYRRSVWDAQSVYVEVWLEKDALAGVLYDVTAEWDVPLMVTRGYPSLSYVYSAAEAIACEDRPAYLYYFGDYDPSGLDISRHLYERLASLAPDAEIHFERVAVTAGQIDEFHLPTRPTKRTDSRSRGFIGESVEVDAIPPAQLRRMVRACIEQHVDKALLAQLEYAESEERRILRWLASPVGRQQVAEAMA